MQLSSRGDFFYLRDGNNIIRINGRVFYQTLDELLTEFKKGFIRSERTISKIIGMVLLDGFSDYNDFVEKFPEYII